MIIYDFLGIILTGVVFVAPFYFVIITSFKDAKEASWMNMNLPSSYHIIENYKSVLQAQGGIILKAFLNSFIITTLSVVGIIIVCSLAGFVLQRREDKFSGFWNFLILFGLIAPPAIVPTVWVLQSLHIYKTLYSMALLEIAFLFPFSTLLYKGFVKTIPRELDEAALLDGCGTFRLFYQIIFPLLKPINITILILSALVVYSDFMYPLFFLPGAKNVTVQLTLYNFMGQYVRSWNLLFADVVLITIPPLILYLFLNKKIIAGMTAGAIK